MNEFEKIVDSIVQEAFTEGFSISYSNYLNRFDVMGRIKVYGFVESNRYYLNEVGVKYAMDGYSKGIRNRMKRMREMEELDIHIKRFNSKWQVVTFILAVIGVLISTLHLLASL